MSEYTVKNYTEPGGEITHIGGLLVFEDGADVENFPLNNIFFQMPNQEASEATTIAALKEDFNALLSSLKASGFMNSELEK